MKIKISKVELKQLILQGISSKELNFKYDYSDITNMSGMFSGCSSLEYINPYNFTLYDFNDLDNKFIKEKYPELYI